ncbi:Seryl-tRNA synthetase [Aphelenchoides bicaudatus]|nr:Seryl-tRNA synthetase [Aphelenchoides bicaudatus]
MSAKSDELLISRDYIKYRQAGPGKSPLGTISVYKDRVEWKENGKDEPLLSIPYNDIKIQRISPPNKDKIQLQIRMHNDDQFTFVFMHPGVTKEALITERDLIKETIQQSLNQYRKIVNDKTVKADKEKNHALEAKKKYLQENLDLQMLYRYLVSSKLISPDAFWSLHHIPMVYKDQLGIPSGFLNSISQTDDGSGIKFNMTADNIRSIFKTYPVVERKHLELVPHEMKEEEFWAKFFQSHYFHRERNMSNDPNDPFFDCDKNDRKEISKEKAQGHFKHSLDFNYLLEDLGLVSEIHQNYFTSMRNDEDEDVDRLVQRCNYHSGRLLSTLVDKSTDEPMETDDQRESVGNNVQLESEELAEMEGSSKQDQGFDVALKQSEFEVGPRSFNEDKSRRWKAKVLKLAKEPSCSQSFIRKFFDELSTNPPESEQQQVYEDFFKTLKPQLINDVKNLYPVTHELLRHFWLVKMYETLVKFEELLLKNASVKVGLKHTENLYTMVKKAKDKMQRIFMYRRLDFLKFVRRYSNASVQFTEDNARIVEHFGAHKRTKEGQKKLFTCEELTHGWKSVLFPHEAIGSRAYAFQSSVSNIEQALLSYALSTALRLKPEFEFVTVNDILPLSTTIACGFPDPKQAEHFMQYQLLDNPSFCLSGTAEMGIADKLKDQTLTGLPRWFVAKSRCFRPEVSKTAAEAKLYRVHEFFKVEMFVVCHPQQSDDILREIVAIQKEVFSGLELHCRLLDMPSEELGASASQKFDIEAWMPGRDLFGEISSASNCTDYQSQRLNIRFKDADGQLKFAHTCNGTVLASTRALIAVLETHQNTARKTCEFPEKLLSWLPTKRSQAIHVGKASAFSYNFDN